LIEDELDRCCRLSEEGGWLEALQRLEALLPQLMQPPMADVAQALLLDLVMGVHQAMVVEESAGLPQEQRAELLWQVHRWLRRGDGIELPSHDWLQPVREQICRTAALAWLDRIEATPETGDGALARQRSLMLLIDLVPFWSPCPDWIGHYLLKGLRGACDPDNRPFHPPADRVDWALALARLPSETAERERLEALLGPALAALHMGNGESRGNLPQWLSLADFTRWADLALESANFIPESPDEPEVVITPAARAMLRQFLRVFRVSNVQAFAGSPSQDMMGQQSPGQGAPLAAPGASGPLGLAPPSVQAATPVAQLGAGGQGPMPTMGGGAGGGIPPQILAMLAAGGGSQAASSTTTFQ
jgi:hypothetical protein